MTTLAERVVALHAALPDVPHAFGGALALAYYAEPRATVDIDLNVFVPTTDLGSVAGPLRSLGADFSAEHVRRAERDGQVRVFWDTTPVDLFFGYDDFHDDAAASVRLVPFADATIPILGPSHLVVCKAVFDRPKDWVDIDAMLAGGTAIEVATVIRWVGRVVGDEDPRYERIAAVLTR
jgi:hypothetical protein